MVNACSFYSIRVQTQIKPQKLCETRRYGFKAFAPERNHSKKPVYGKPGRE